MNCKWGLLCRHQVQDTQHFRCRASKRVTYTGTCFPGGTARGKAQALRWGPQQNTLWEKDHQKGNARRGREWGRGWKHKPRQCTLFPRGQRVSLAPANWFGEKIFQKLYVVIGWMDKEDVAHIYNGILLSHKKKRTWVICTEVDEPRVCHTEWSKSEREKQILYANTYIWNLKKKNGSEEPRGRTGIKAQT